VLIHQPLDLGDLLGRDRSVMREIEPQTRRLNDAARLFHMSPENGS
jgi:hypothetical protein